MNKLIWTDNEMGYIIKYIDEVEISRYCVYTLSYGSRKAIDGYIHYICRHPLSIQQVINNTVVDGPPQFINDSSRTIFFSAQ